MFFFICQISLLDTKELNNRVLCPQNIESYDRWNYAKEEIVYLQYLFMLLEFVISISFISYLYYETNLHNLELNLGLLHGRQG